jgi:hypothetical protein
MGFSTEKYLFHVTNLTSLQARHGTGFEHLDGQGNKLPSRVFAEGSLKYV